MEFAEIKQTNISEKSLLFSMYSSTLSTVYLSSPLVLAVNKFHIL